jgi:hypothetical protein
VSASRPRAGRERTRIGGTEFGEQGNGNERAHSECRAVIAHGVSVTPLMNMYERRLKARATMTGRAWMIACSTSSRACRDWRWLPDLSSDRSFSGPFLYTA